MEQPLYSSGNNSNLIVLNVYGKSVLINHSVLCHILILYIVMHTCIVSLTVRNRFIKL